MHKKISSEKIFVAMSPVLYFILVNMNIMLIFYIPSKALS